MKPVEITTAADRLAMTLDGLCRAVAARIAGGAMAAAMILLVWTRIRRAERQIQALLIRFRTRGFQAGLVRVSSGMRRPATAESPRNPTVRLPRGFGWLCPLVPCEAANFGSQLRVVLSDPEMVALLRASPQARRIMAPVCRMLAVEPEVLQRPDVAEAPVRACEVEPAVVGESAGRISAARGADGWRCAYPRYKKSHEMLVPD